MFFLSTGMYVKALKRKQAMNQTTRQVGPMTVVLMLIGGNRILKPLVSSAFK